MKLHTAAGVIASCILSTGCAYLGHRARDFRDVFTLAVEDHTIGCLVPPFGVHSSDGRGFGLREGHWGSYKHIESWQGPVPGYGGYFDVEFRPANDYRNKGYNIDSDDSWAGPNGQLWLNPQVAVGLYYGLRVGLNLAEVADFVLGWTTLDILKDDVDAPSYLRAKPDQVSDVNRKSNRATTEKGPANESSQAIDASAPQPER